ncbi:serine beta-lactamase-like protein LACTB, mitochondrial isoform X2 [Pleurodeles waltl]|uniref:serine beta-lactamase-like protein LACTB, mitochondrial isoform X2 n=1 Tax=Pleurodeles waltl TaxID=8319 RepID=UPI00370959D0
MLVAVRPGAHRLWALGAGLGLTLGLAVGSSGETPDREEPKAFSRAIEASRELVRRIRVEVGAPGIVVGVSVDGKEVWSEGMGFADVENRVPCKPGTVMRIASISKSLTMTAIAKLWEEGKLDLDAPVQKYVPEFPEKEFEGEKVTITTRLLVSHLSGIRHYEKDVTKAREKISKKGLKSSKDATSLKTLEAVKGKEPASGGKQASDKAYHTIDKGTAFEAKEELGSDSKGQSSFLAKKEKEFDAEEYYLKEKFESVIESLKLFKNDPLVFKPGSQFFYSTHAWTLLSAVVERASGENFLDYMLKMFHEMGMSNTLQDEHEPVIYNRARYYMYNKKGRLVNAPYVDNSYKWAGGGFLSTVGDLLTFGNVLLYSYQVQRFRNTGRKLLPGYLKPGTITMMWTPVPNTEMSWDKDGKYAMGWAAVESKQEYGHCRQQRHYVSHTGGAVGGSSVLLILPEESDSSHLDTDGHLPPRGVVVSLITNMQSVGLNSTALKIAREFDKDKLASCYQSDNCLQTEVTDKCT